MAQVRLKNVDKYFGHPQDPESVRAVNDLSLDIADGEFLVLLGPSGCGKTTTLRMVAGLETSTTGEISIGDRVVNDLPPGERDIAFVFQFYALYPHLTVKDNISFPLRAQNLPKAEVEQRVNRVAQQLKIDHVLKRRPNRLPSGDQQRVALGRAMVRQPQVFLMDEPLTNLDASLRAEMRVELKYLQQELATTMIYVTHDQVEAMSMGHRIAVMNNGLLQQVDTPLNIYNRPQTLFVATFIGSPPMNTLACQLIEGRQLQGQRTDFSLTIDPQVAGRITGNSTTRNVMLGIRSEDIQITKTDEDADIRGVVAVREPLGDETIYKIDLAGYSPLVKTSPKQIHHPGETVGLRINQDRLHLFDSETEQSIL